MRFLPLLIFISTSGVALGQSQFIKSCEAPASPMISEQIQWLKFRFKENSCKSLASTISKLNTFDDIFPSRVTDSQINRIPYEIPELRSSALLPEKFNLQWDQGIKAASDLSIFKEFINLKHFSHHADDPQSICEKKKQIPSLEKVTIDPWNILNPDIDCISKYKLKVYVIEDFHPRPDFEKIKNQIYGIKNYVGDVNSLPKFKNLSYLGLLNYLGKSDLRVLTNIVNLTHLHINTRDINVKDIGILPTLSFLTLTCYQDVSYISDDTTHEDYRCKGNALKDLNFLANFPYLQGLDISWNEVQDLSPVAGLEHLRYLIARWNQIAELPHMSALKKLEYLDLSHNQVVDIDPLKSAKNLRFLHLADNRIQNFASVSRLSKLKYLSVVANPMSSLLTLRPPTSVELLAISGSHARLFNQNIALSWFLQSIPTEKDERYWPEQMLFDDIEKFDFTDSFIYVQGPDQPESNVLRSFDFKRLKNLKVLSLRNAGLRELPTLSNLNQLRYLDSSNNAISGDLPLPKNLEYLFLRRGYYGEFAQLNKLSKLKFLDLSFSKLTNSEEKLIAPQLFELRLEDCGLTEVPDLSGMPGLQILQLDGNFLSNFRSASLPLLFMLTLGRNQFEAVPSLKQLPNLSELFLNDNKITNLDNLESFGQSVPNPQLFISNNRISDLSKLRNSEFSHIHFHLQGNPAKEKGGVCPKDSPNPTVYEFCNSDL